MGISIYLSISETQTSRIHQDLTLGLPRLPNGKMQPAHHLGETTLHPPATKSGGQIDIDPVHLTQRTEVKSHGFPIPTGYEQTDQ